MNAKLLNSKHKDERSSLVKIYVSVWYSKNLRNIETTFSKTGW